MALQDKISALAVLAGSLALTGPQALAQSTGNRTINGPLVNSGTLTPGSATQAGLLTVNGNFTQTASGTLLFRLGSPGKPIDQMFLSNGSAQLGGTLQVTANRDVETGKAFYLIQADRGITGTFASVVNPNNLGLFRSFSLLRDANSLYFIVNRLSFGTAGTNINQVSVGQGLDRTVDGSLTSTAFAQAREDIGQLTAAGAAAKLQRISGESNASAITTAQVSARAFGEALLRAADDGRGEIKRKRKGGFSLWAQGVAGNEEIADAKAGLAKVSADAQGGAVGVDYAFGRWLRVGIAGGYTSGTGTVALPGASHGADITHIGLYAQIDTDFELALALGYGIADYKVARLTDNNQLVSSSPKGNTLSARLSLAIPYRLASGVRLSPYVAYAIDQVKRDAFIEGGSDLYRLNVARRTTTLGEAQLGGRIGATFISYDSPLFGEEARLVPELKLGFSYLSRPSRASTQQSFVNAADGGFTVFGPEREQKAGVAGLSVTLRLSSGFSAYFDYSARVANQLSWVGLGGMRYVF